MTTVKIEPSDALVSPARGAGWLTCDALHCLRLRA